MISMAMRIDGVDFTDIYDFGICALYGPNALLSSTGSSFDGSWQGDVDNYQYESFPSDYTVGRQPVSQTSTNFYGMHPEGIRFIYNNFTDTIDDQPSLYQPESIRRPYPSSYWKSDFRRNKYNVSLHSLKGNISTLQTRCNV